MNTDTRLFCVFGDPVAQSKSPVMHNKAMAHLGYNGVYLAFLVTDIGRAMDAVRTLGIRGASITVPHKSTVMDYLDEVDETARRMGAVNTVINKDGYLSGCNTDGPGALRALEDACEVRDNKAVILGSGGAARAIAFSLKQAGASVIIVNRDCDRQEGEALAKDLDCPFVVAQALEQLSHTCDILINATPVGMYPHVDDSPVDKLFFRPGMTVMDIVYNPLETRLLREARAAGCKTVDGAAMFVYQGAAQFSMWIGKPAPVEIMRAAVLEALA